MFGLQFDPVTFFGFMLGFVIGTTFHEFMHAYSAFLLGDDTAARQGRITLNPAAHFDPFGFIMGILLALGIGGIAWGRPVPVNPYALKGGRRGMAIVAVAGPVSNLVFASALVLFYHGASGMLPPQVKGVIENMILINVLLFCFNLIPIPPLDGFNILVGILPNYWNVVLEPIRRYALPILIGFVFLVPYVGNALRFDLNPITEILRPVAGGILRIFGLT
ncbi:MAG TPA: site-2 protease family protein [Chloroflexia bacterium]|nr:site-2 protease family protein [Chloroflexia bacterium]HYP21571.1 site-2 protease family protein [Chloroflexia bacterium]